LPLNRLRAINQETAGSVLDIGVRAEAAGIGVFLRALRRRAPVPGRKLNLDSMH
jgi:hypothetical protein